MGPWMILHPAVPEEKIKLVVYSLHVPLSRCAFHFYCNCWERNRKEKPFYTSSMFSYIIESSITEPGMGLMYFYKPSEEPMKLSAFFVGPLAPIFSHTIVLVILGLMFVVSLRLYVDRRKKGYLSMTISLSFLMIYYLFLIYFDLGETENGLAVYVSMLLHMISFILVNMGVYQIYNPTKRKHYLFFYGLITLGAAISLLHLYVPGLYHGSQYRVHLLQDLGMELYMFLLIFVFFRVIPPLIGQQRKYRFALIIYLCNQIAHLINAYFIETPYVFLSVIEHILPVFFYFLLFLLLFERVVELIQAIYNSSITDGLTQLYNRKFFSSRVFQYVQRQLPIAILFSDIDNFKKLNDTKGHQMGDNVLKQVASIMKEECEDCGLAGRYGGEEIVMLITDPTVNIEAFAERLRKRVEEETIVTVSVGYSLLQKGFTAEQLIKQADEAMYLAKTNGKNKVVRYG
jgi:diguanylate cyclase (GGDEF)-like protein